MRQEAFRSLGALGPNAAAAVPALIDFLNSQKDGLDFWAMEALGRNPEAAGAIQTNMILAIAFTEAIGIYALVVAILIGFVF